MNTTPLLTVLLVICNHRNNFVEAMESVLCQKKICLNKIKNRVVVCYDADQTFWLQS